MVLASVLQQTALVMMSNGIHSDGLEHYCCMVRKFGVPSHHDAIACANPSCPMVRFWSPLVGPHVFVVVYGEVLVELQV
eukprot:6473295-Amphidinium_carterae.1